MAIRLFAFDLDGTTITEHKYLSEENRQALLAARERGVILAPATGRMMSFLPQEILALPGISYVITSNGAMVYDQEEKAPIFQYLIPNETAQKVERLLQDYDVYVEYYRNGRAITKWGYPELAKPHFQFPASKEHFLTKDYDFTESFEQLVQETGICPEKINLPFLLPGVREELWEKLGRIEDLALTSSIPDNIEINWSGAHKGKALQALAQRLGLERDEVMAIGDNGNDVTMLEYAGCSVAVGDGAPAALSAAGHRVAPHDENGLAQAVKQFILI